MGLVGEVVKDRLKIGIGDGAEQPRVWECIGAAADRLSCRETRGIEAKRAGRFK
jgi:hypothetical protein